MFHRNIKSGKGHRESEWVVAISCRLLKESLSNKLAGKQRCGGCGVLGGARARSRMRACEV